MLLFQSWSGCRTLHSFPTRRSSDLSGWNPFQLAPTERNIAFLEKLVRRCAYRADRPFTPADDKAIFSRSEEHTSELQSRREIVCRLLLEKKKTTMTM